MVTFRIIDVPLFIESFNIKLQSMHKSTIIKDCFHNTICVWRLFQHILANVTNKFKKKHDMEHKSLKTPSNVSLISIKIFNGNILPHGTNCFPSGFLATIFLFLRKSEINLHSKWPYLWAICNYCYFVLLHKMTFISLQWGKTVSYIPTSPQYFSHVIIEIKTVSTLTFHKSIFLKYNAANMWLCTVIIRHEVKFSCFWSSNFANNQLLRISFMPQAFRK